MKKVLIPTKLDLVAKQLLEESGNYEVVQDESENLPALALANPDAHAVIVRSNKLTPEIIDTLPSLKVVVRAGAGFNTIDTAYSREKGIDVMNTPGANSNAVAEEVICMMLADARHIVYADPSVRAGKWEKKNLMGKEITGKIIGLVGLGAIGGLVAKRLQGFEMEILCYDPYVSEENSTALGVKMLPLNELLAKSDYVSLHMPENDKTKGIVNAEFLSKMKDGATLINCARAGLINEDDLRKAKSETGIRFLNDVYAKDAEGEKSVADIADVMMPHLGASTVEANYNAAKRAAEELMELDETGNSAFIVN